MYLKNMFTQLEILILLPVPLLSVSIKSQFDLTDKGSSCSNALTHEMMVWISAKALSVMAEAFHSSFVLQTISGIVP